MASFVREGRAGAAIIIMEDRRSPLGTPTAGGIAVISKEAAIGKFKAAADARKDRDFFIIGRTESFWSEGL
jgi:2-methylisocitrate lyase-like PEP mutase family enzyme